MQSASDGNMPKPSVALDAEREQAARSWQSTTWDRIAPRYDQDVEHRFADVIEQMLMRADLRPGHRVLDLGTGTGSAALKAAPLVMPNGHVLGVDISHEMLMLAEQRANRAGLTNVVFCKGRAEAIPESDAVCDRVIASLSLMYAIDRAAAAREIRRVLQPDGLFIAAVWTGPEHADIVRFQQTVGRFAPPPPVPGVGPGALADPSTFVASLAQEGVEAHIEQEAVNFTFASFEDAWDVLAAVTTAALAPDRRQDAQASVRAAMWPQGDGPRVFHNVVQYIIGKRV